MRYCSRCGTEVGQRDAFCPNSGAVLRVTRPERRVSLDTVAIAAVLAVIVAIPTGLAAYVPYQVHVVRVGVSSFTLLPPTVTVRITLSNPGFFEVLADAVFSVTLRSGEKAEFHFDTATIPSQGNGTLSTTIYVSGDPESWTSERGCEVWVDRRFSI